MGLGSTNGGSSATFLSIIGGKIKQQAEEETPGAEKRKWETKDGKSGIKYEITHDFIEGNIVGLSYHDGDYGTSLAVKIQDGADTYNLQISTKSRYYDDFAKKVKALDLNKPVKLSPYDFEDKEKKDKKGNPKKISGISVYQEGEKIVNYYYDGKKNINGMPKVNEKEKEELADAYWTVYFAKVGAFLKKEIEAINVPAPKAVEVQEQESSDSDDNDNLPF